MRSFTNIVEMENVGEPKISEKSVSLGKLYMLVYSGHK